MRYAGTLRQVRLFLTGAALLLLVGCALPTIDYGSPPPTDALATLALKVSTDADVLKTLGEPQGRGLVQHRPNERPGKVWLYYYGKSVGMDYRGKYLFIFLDENVYVGYLWYSSEITMKKQ
jgi:hypothetical protein